VERNKDESFTDQSVSIDLSHDSSDNDSLDQGQIIDVEYLNEIQKIKQ